MRMTYAEPFSTAAITASLAKLRIDQASVEAAIRRTVSDLARQPTPAIARMENVPAPAPRRAVRRTVAKVAKGAPAKFPGTAPETWEDLDAEQLAWFRERYPGSLELRLGKIAKGQTPINSPSYIVALLAKYRTKRPFVDKSPDYKADRERIDGLAYVLKGDWDAPLNKDHTQHVFETDPFLYDACERKSCRYRIGPPQAWQAEWRLAHFVTSESEYQRLVTEATGKPERDDDDTHTGPMAHCSLRRERSAASKDCQREHASTNGSRPSWHISNGLRGCYMPDSACVVRVRSRRELKDVIASQDPSDDAPSKRDVAWLANAAWRNRNSKHFHLPIATAYPGNSSYALFVAPACKADWISEQENGA